MLTYYLGDIARFDAYCEHESRILWWRLARNAWPLLAGPTPASEPITFERVLESSKVLLRVVALDEEIRGIVRRILDDTQAQHKIRNQLTHDIWMAQGADSDIWASIKARSSRKKLKAHRGLADFEKCRTRLSRLLFRLRAADQILPEWLGQAPDAYWTEESRNFWTAVAMDRFKQVPYSIVPLPVRIPEVRVSVRP